MDKLVHRHKVHWSNPSFLYSTILGFVLLSLSIVLNHFADNYATKKASNIVSDIILSNTRVFDVDGILIFFTIAFVIFGITLLVIHPRRIPFVLKSIAVFIVVRAFFMSATHIGQFAPQIPLGPSFFYNLLELTNQGGLFFSGHTGMPFLLALIFWKEKLVGYTFLAISIILGTCLLLGHIHYSIDVLSAFFITPSIFYIAKKFFAKDYLIFSEEH